MKTINLDSNRFGAATSFAISIQGSSTKTLKSKNFTLGISKDESYTQEILFSPNYKKDDPSTFLPEREFTLKADVIDSSHSNNTSIGSFINTINKFDYDKKQEGVDQKVSEHVRQCLEGFPVLIFLDITEGGQTKDMYYLGVYNFNLGRGSYFNLAYTDLSVLNDLEDVSEGGFVFKEVSDLNIKPQFIAAEVQDNSKYWDFSQ